MKKNNQQVYQFKISLKDIKPTIWRQIQVPEHYTFWDLHVAIQDAIETILNLLDSAKRLLLKK